MAENGSKHYSLEALRELNRRGQLPAAPTDAPVVDFDEDFWHELESARALPSGSAVVELVIPKATVERFATMNEDYLTEMAHVLAAYAAAKAKKAS